MIETALHSVVVVVVVISVATRGQAGFNRPGLK